MYNLLVDEKVVKRHCERVIKKCKEEINIVKSEKIEKTSDDFKNFTEEQIEVANDKFQSFITWIEENEHLELIIASKPKDLLKIYKEIVDKFSFKIDVMENGQWVKKEVFDISGVYGKTIKEKIIRIFDYKWFRDKYAYEFTKELNINICPYCNREYIFTIFSESINGKSIKKIARPELDHYFPQHIYPMFALSFYNLIPSGHICNSNIKGMKFLDIERYLHPYVDENKDFRFCLDIKGESGINPQIYIDTGENDKVKNTIDFFMLPEIYKFHNDLAEDAIELFRRYPPKYLVDYLQRLKDLGIDYFGIRNIGDILEILYKSYIVKKVDNEMLGKLRNDLYGEICDVYMRYVKECTTE